MTSAKSERVLRIARADSEGNYVLLNLSTDGSSPLDLKLLATEGDNPYIGSLRQSNISTTRDKKNQQNDVEWESSLFDALFKPASLASTSKKTVDTAPSEKVETVAIVNGDYLVIRVRRNTSGIIQGLGEIPLRLDENQEIDVTSWAATAVERSTGLELELQDLTAKYDKQSKEMQDLNQQLDDLIEAKRTHETEMLEKFRDLLNAKKLKIRDQQRLLATAKVDPVQLKKLRYAMDDCKRRVPDESRQGKRKAKDGGSGSSEDAKDMDDENIGKEEDDLPDQQDTPEASQDDLTQDEDDDGSDPSRRVMPHRVADATQDRMQIDTSPPPRRFNTRERFSYSPDKHETSSMSKGEEHTTRQEDPTDDRETEDDDDEL